MKVSAVVTEITDPNRIVSIDIVSIPSPQAVDWKEAGR
jgi:hypothetical protein